ncbi:hypothetical protein P2318_30930 [Myxococcaceae bacterium GXIMD 01537]
MSSTSTPSPSLALLGLLAPALVLAEDSSKPLPQDVPATQSPLFWYWMVVLAVALTITAWRLVTRGRRGGGPPMTHAR